MSGGVQFRLRPALLGNSGDQRISMKLLPLSLNLKTLKQPRFAPEGTKLRPPPLGEKGVDLKGTKRIRPIFPEERLNEAAGAADASRAR